MSSFDAGRLIATADLDRSPFQHGLRLVRDEGERFSRETYKANIAADTKDADRDLTTFDARLRKVAATRATAQVALDNGEAVRKLITFQERLDAMRAKVATVKADVDDTAAKAKLDALDIQLRRIGLVTSRPRVSLEGVERANLQLDALGLKLAAVGGAGGGGGGRGFGGPSGGRFSRLPNPSLMALAVGAALPLAGPLGGAALGGAASFLTPTIAGSLGLAGFGAAAKSSVTTITKDIANLNKLTLAYDAATTNKQRAAVLTKEAALWKALDPAQRQAVKNVQGLDSAWASYKKKLEPQTFAAVAGGAKLGQTGLGLLLPSAQAAGNTIVSLERQAEHALQSPFFRYFFDKFLSRETAHAIDSLGVSFGHVGDGFAHLAVGFAPLGHDLERGMVNLSKRFDEWTQGSGPARFVAWVEKEGPIVGKTLLALVHGIEGLGNGLMPIGELEFKALEPVLNFIGDLGKSHPAVITALGGALLAVGGGLKLIKAAGTVGTLFGRGGGGGPLGGGGGILGSLKPVPVYVTNWEGGVPGVGTPGGGKRKVPGVPAALTGLALPLTEAYLATQGGDAGTSAIRHYQQTARGPLGNALLGIASPIALHGGSGLDPNLMNFTSGVHSENVNIPGAVRFIETYGSKSQVAQLQQLAKLYPQVAAALKDYNTQGANLNKWLIGNLGLSKKAADAALSSGRVIGRNISIGMTEGIDAGFKTHVLRAVTTMADGTIKVVSTKFELGSPSRLMIRYGKWIAQGLEIGFASEQANLDRIFGKVTGSTIARIGTAGTAALTQYRADLAARAQLQGSLSSGLLGALDIGNATVLGGATAGGGVKGFLTSEVGNLRKLVIDIKKLAKMGLTPILLQQILNAGPDHGLQIAEEILSGADGSITSLNNLEKSAQTYANTAASVVAGATYRGALSKDEKTLLRIAASLEHLVAKSGRFNKADMLTLAHDIATELAKVLPAAEIATIDKVLGVDVRSHR